MYFGWVEPLLQEFALSLTATAYTTHLLMYTSVGCGVHVGKRERERDTKLMSCDVGMGLSCVEVCDVST